MKIHDYTGGYPPVNVVKDLSTDPYFEDDWEDYEQKIINAARHQLSGKSILVFDVETGGREALIELDIETEYWKLVEWNDYNTITNDQFTIIEVYSRETNMPIQYLIVENEPIVFEPGETAASHFDDHPQELLNKIDSYIQNYDYVSYHM